LKETACSGEGVDYIKDDGDKGDDGGHGYYDNHDYDGEKEVSQEV
jgi:hypothetical protein